eukprot:4229656-Pyramimonas_sp.AAC.1
MGTTSALACKCGQRLSESTVPYQGDVANAQAKVTSSARATAHCPNESVVTAQATALLPFRN